MKKFAYFALSILAVFAFASCGEDEIDYSDSYMRFTASGIGEQTWGWASDCYAAFSGSATAGYNLILFAADPNSADTLKIDVDIGVEDFHTRGHVGEAVLFFTSNTYKGEITVGFPDLTVVPALGEIVEGHFDIPATLTKIGGSETIAISNGKIHLVRNK